MNQKPVILTGLRANNDLHIGNYLGGLLPIIDMANQRADEYQINLFVPDLHSFTTRINHATLQESIMQNLRVFVAAGLPLSDPNVHIYRQSYIPAHSELTWILDCFTGYGEMSRMTQFKDKSKSSSFTEESTSTSVGLFNYPVLMAADILLYGAKYIPVGDDQSQHLEFTRDIAQRMNNRFGDVFIVPEAVTAQHEFFGKDQGLRVKDLSDPGKKMSKSDESGKGVLFLTDSPDVASKKIMSATTDSLGSIAYNKVEQPGIATLLELMAFLQAKDVHDVVSEYQGQEQYGPLKTAVTTVVTEFLTSFQTKLAAVDDTAIMHKLADSEAAMAVQAQNTLLRVQRAVGLRP
ncbi:MAG: tryptophan--tRNA ligase [Patescibacteria group bacterium]|nr:tryptophan--tRNA ligase [Patescibacteria group bacterium]